MIENLAERALVAQGGRKQILRFPDFEQEIAIVGPESAARTLFFVPPLGEGWSTWLRLLPRMKDHGQCVAVDPPRYHDHREPSVADHARALATLVQDWDGHVFDFVGASLGALVALRAARRSPIRPRTLTLLGLGPDLGHLGYLESLFDLQSVADVQAFMSKAWSSPAPGSDPRIAASVLDRMNAASVRALAMDAARCDLRQELLSTLALEISVAFVYGADDRLHDQASRCDAPLPASVRAHRLDQCGHYPHVEQTGQCAALLAAHLHANMAGPAQK